MSIHFRNILDVPVDVQQKVRLWRNNEKIRRVMFNDHIITEEEHNKWLASLPTSKHQKVWIAFDDETPLGVWALQEISPENKRTDFGAYLNPELNALGIGAEIEYMFLKEIFEKWDYEKVNCSVLSSNMPLVDFHKKFGFIEEGIRREHILRNSGKLDCHLLGLVKKEWLTTREKYEPFFD